MAITEGYKFVYSWFDILQAQGHFITGYVIMPNHVHDTIAFRKTTKSINKIIEDGIRFIGYAMGKRLQEQRLNELLHYLQDGVNDSDCQKDKVHEIWEDSFDWKECTSDIFTWQKLDYLHENPCVGKWSLAGNAMEYPHSSARFYLTGIHAAYRVLNFKDIADINLANPD